MTNQRMKPNDLLRFHLLNHPAFGDFRLHPGWVGNWKYGDPWIELKGLFTPVQLQVITEFMARRGYEG